MTEEIDKGGSFLNLKNFFRLALVICILIPLVITFLLQFSSVQNWVGDRVTEKISKTLGTEVSVGNVNFSITRGIVLDSFYVENHNADTLLFIGDASTTLIQNLGSLIQNKLFLNTIQVNDVFVHIEQSKGDSLTNLDRLLKKISGGEGGGEKAAPVFQIGLEEVHLRNLRFIKDNPNNGQNIDLNVSSGIVKIDTLNFDRNHFSFTELIFTHPVCHITIDEHEKVFFESNVKKLDTIITNNESLIEIGNFVLTNGEFSFNDNRKAPKVLKVEAMDYAHFHLLNLEIDASEFQVLNSKRFLATFNNIALEEKNGFVIQELNVSDFYLDDKKVQLDGLLLKTNQSEIKEKIHFYYDGFEDFKTFANDVELDIDFKSSKLSLYDLTYFFSDIYRSSFFSKNYNRDFRINGKFKGTPDRLRATDVSLSIDNLLNFDGRFSFRNLTDTENALISFKIDKLNSSIPKLRKVLPKFNPPSNFDLLGEINYKGRFSGSIFDFVSFGVINTALGEVDTDLRMDLREGVSNATYSGFLDLKSFDLKTWSGNDDFDKLSLSAEIINGQGLKLENAFANLSAQLNDFSFKGYKYENVNFEGKIDKSKFNGKLDIDDEFVDLNFDGNLDFSGEVILADFKAKVDLLDFENLNLIEENLSVKGDFDVELVGTGINDFVGDALLENIIIERKEKVYKFDSLYLASSPSEKEGRLVELQSDFVNTRLEGIFNLEDLDQHFKYYLHEYYPAWAKKINIPRSNILKNDQRFELELVVEDSKNYFDLIGVSGLRLINTRLNTQANFDSHRLNGTLSARQVIYNDLDFREIRMILNNDRQVSDFSFNTDSLLLNENLFENIELLSHLDYDSLRLILNTDKLIDSLGKVELIADLFPQEDAIEIHFDQNTFEMLNTDWRFNENNNIVISKDEIQIDELILTDGRRKLSLNDINNKGVKVDFDEFNFFLINEIIDYDRIDFTGVGALSVSYDNIFENGNLEAEYTIPNFKLNGDSYGMLKVIASSIDKDVLGVVLRIYRIEDGQDIKVEGVYNTKTKDIDAEVIASNFDLRLFEYIIKDGISNTKGTAELDARLKGNLDDPKLYGEATLNNGGTRINYLGNYINFHNQKISLTEKYVNLNGLQIKDRLGNIGVFSGGLNHYFLGDFTIDLNIYSDYFLSLDTRKEDNPLYYGQGLGEITIDISGDFGSPNFIVTATTGVGAVINIPIESSESDFDESFVKFVNRKTPKETVKDEPVNDRALEIEGVNFDMNLTITPDAFINVIFDERTNDIIKGRGRGDIQLEINRRGDFEVFGNYEVESGEYLFTALGIIAKPFTVKRGGTINWTGDPFNATLNIDAFYEGIKTPLDVFLSEYLVNETIASQDAKNRQDVDLTMKINGFLYSPNIQFDMFFPEVAGELKSYTDSKMRTLRQNENELNDQVAGLILFGSFLPSNNALGSNLTSTGSFISGGYNTISEMIGNQLSILLSGILDEAFTEDGIITGLDFDVGFNKNAQFVEGEIANTSFIPDEIEVHLRPEFQNDRWGIDVGTNYVRQSGGNGTIENYVVNDFVIEYFLTQDRRLKLRAYAKNDYDVFTTQREQKFGVGLSYRKEFGSLTELDKLKKKEEKEEANDK